MSVGAWFLSSRRIPADAEAAAGSGRLAAPGPGRRALLATLVSLALGTAVLGGPSKSGPPAAASKSASPPKSAAVALPSLDDAPQDTFSGVARVIAIGDIHGDFKAIQECLTLAGLIDAKGHWSGGKTHFVQTGDIPDRGPDTRRIFDLLMQLEQEAAQAGGRVIPLLGNHEVMNMDGDLRYVTREEMASYADLSSTPDPAGLPTGSVGHAIAFSREGRYGRWLRSHAAVVKVNDALFLHGGISPTVQAPTLPALNRWIRQDLFKGSPAGGARLSDGPLWFRGYALSPEATLAAELDTVLKRYGAKRMVMGHTPTEGEITLRFQGKAVFIDTGISAHYGGHRSALEMTSQGLTALYPGQKVPLKSTGATTPPLK